MHTEWILSTSNIKILLFLSYFHSVALGVDVWISPQGRKAFVSIKFLRLNAIQFLSENMWKWYKLWSQKTLSSACTNSMLVLYRLPKIGIKFFNFIPPFIRLYIHTRNILFFVSHVCMYNLRMCTYHWQKQQ